MTMWVLSIKVTLLQVMVMLLLMMVIYHTNPKSSTMNFGTTRSLSEDRFLGSVANSAPSPSPSSVVTFAPSLSNHDDHHNSGVTLAPTSSSNGTEEAIAVEHELALLDEELLADEHDIEHMLDEVHDAEHTGHPLNATHVEHELIHLEEHLKEAEHEILHLETELHTLEHEVEHLQEELHTAETEIGVLKGEVQTLEAEIHNFPAEEQAKLLKEASAVFGIVAIIESKYGTITFIGFLIFLVGLEHGFENLEHMAEDAGVSMLFEKLKKELMMMGIISFVVFIFTTAGGQANKLLYESFEMTHVIVLFMALAFICQAFFIVSYASTAGKRYLNALRTSSMKLLRMYKKCRFDPKQWWYFHHGSSMLPAHPSFRTDIEFRIIERLFTFQHKLSADFNFANYVNMLFMQYTAELSEVTPVGWFMLACLVALNYLRIAVLDPILKGERCNVMQPSLYGYQSLDALPKEHRFLAGSSDFGANTNDDETYLGTPACNTYLIGFNYCCAALLVILAISVYLLSTIYIDRVIRRSLELDKIDNHPDGIRYAYKDSLDIMVRREKMLAHAELMRKKKLKLGIIEQEFTATKPKLMNTTGGATDSGNNHNASHTSDQLGEKLGSFLQHNEKAQAAAIHGDESITPAASPSKYSKSIGDAFSNVWGTVKGNLRLSGKSTVVLPVENPHDEGISKTSRKGDDGEEHQDDDGKKPEDMEAGTVAAAAAAKHKKKKMEKNLDSIFMFGSPSLFFRSVEALLLFQCFYISMACTQFIPIATKVNANVGGFVIGFLIPIFIVFYIIQLSLNKTVLLRAVFELDREVAGKVVEEAKEEKVAIIKMKDAVFKHLADEEVADDEIQNYLKEYFFRYDTKETGEVGEKDFKKVLGDLGVYLSRDGFRILWTAVDFDLSGALSWDEITDILFEADTDDEEPELEAVIELRQALQEMLASQEVPITELESYLEGVFKSFDEDGSGDMEEDEFAGLLHTLGIKVAQDKISDVFSAIDTEHSNGISFDEFFAVVFRKHKAMTSAANADNDDD